MDEISFSVSFFFANGVVEEFSSLLNNLEALGVSKLVFYCLAMEIGLKV